MPSRAAITGADLRRVRLGPLLVAGHRVAVRNTRLSDFARWREIRLRDREFIEPFWTTSALNWEQRHTRAWWIREYLRQRRDRAAGRALPLSILVDGEFAGQCNLVPVDPRHRSAELGIWMDSRRARHGVGAMAGALLTEFALGPLGLHRITAPACVGNRVARQSAIRAAMTHEATMIRALSVAGRRQDHELWAVTSDRTPAAGWVGALIAAGVDAEPLPAEQVSAHRRAAECRREVIDTAPAAVIAVAARYYLGAPLRWWRSGADAEFPDSITGRDPDEQPVTLRKRTSRWGFRHGRLARYEVLVADRPIGALALDRGGANLALSLEFTPDSARTTAAETAAALLVRFALNDLGGERIEALVDPADTHLTALARAAGLTREGTLCGARLDPDGTFHDAELWAAVDPGLRS
ncbi:GNAT family N-acetyltransferase [Nocardia jejuensis]|uniref:GNAT family N-acetyltransferase n=1 Tax=Nocardia jejuensis TaxID=328049 RepID=UPI00082F20AB|nr:GNAT family protein [Nocardia jejuensis]